MGEHGRSEVGQRYLSHLVVDAPRRDGWRTHDDAAELLPRSSQLDHRLVHVVLSGRRALRWSPVRGHAVCRPVHFRHRCRDRGRLRRYLHF